MQVCPHDLAVDGLGQMQQMVVVVPVDADVDEAQDVTEMIGQLLTVRASSRRAAA
jgi:hypothetical protein